jgi:hypothetical protein
MRCLTLEKVFERNKQKFEYLGSGEYKFWNDNNGVITEYCGPAEYRDEYEISPDGLIDYHYVKYEKREKSDNSRECAWLTWDYPREITCDIPDFCPTLYRWCNAMNKEHRFNYYLDDDSKLHATLRTILPSNDEVAEEVCQTAWDEFHWMTLFTLMLVVKEYDKPEPFSLKPLTEYDKMIMKKNFNSQVKVISMPSREESFADIQKHLQDEINELKVSAAAGEISAEEAEAKIKELEQIMQMLQP